MAGKIRGAFRRLFGKKPPRPKYPPHGYRGVRAVSLKPGEIRPGAIEEAGKGENVSEDEANDFLYGMAILPVSSSNVEAAQFDSEGKKMIVKFLKDGFYEYENISDGDADEFLMAMSKGGWVWDRLRVRGFRERHRKPYKKVGGFRQPKISKQAAEQYFEQEVSPKTEEEILEDFVEGMME